MPVLSIDVSRGAGTAIYISEKLSYKIVRVPLVIPRIFSANRFTRESLFKVFLGFIEGELGKKITPDTHIYASVISDTLASIDGAQFCHKDLAFKALSGIDFLYFGHLHVGSNEGVFDSLVDFRDLLDDLYFEEDEQTVVNYFQNFELYPFVQANSERDYLVEEAYLKAITRRHCEIKHNSQPFVTPKRIVFTTTRNISTELLLSRFMFLCVESLCDEGIYDFRLDQHDFLGALAAFAYFDKSGFDKIAIPDFLSLGAVINLNESISIEITPPSGVAVKLNLPKGQLFAFPLPESDEANIKIHSGKYGDIENKVRGGAFGIVIDTRDKFARSTLLPDQRKEIIRQWEGALVEVLKGL